MRELELDGIHDDGEHVVLLDSDGEKYTLRITEALRAAVRRDRPALGAIQAADSAPLRPREIQTMLRSGRSAEEIADIAQVPVEHVRRYEGPVLAERAWAAQRARGFAVGRGGPVLEDVVTERLRAREAAEDTAWDAWRRPDGTWTLELTFSAAGRTRQAHWVVDLDSRSVTPLDDEARWITDDEPPVEPHRGRARLAAVRSSVFDVEAEDSASGSAPRTWRPARRGRGEHPAGLPESELDALNARRGLRPVPSPDAATVWSALDDADESDAPQAPGQREHEASTEDLDPDAQALAEHRSEREEVAEDPGSEPEADLTTGEGPAEPAAETSSSAEADAQGHDSDRGDESGTAAEADAADEEIQNLETVDLTPLPGFDGPSRERPRETSRPASTENRRGSKQRRPSIPSWDEIVFGSKHD